MTNVSGLTNVFATTSLVYIYLCNASKHDVYGGTEFKVGEFVTLYVYVISLVANVRSHYTCGFFSRCEYNQEMPQPHTTDQARAPLGETQNTNIYISSRR